MSNLLILDFEANCTDTDEFPRHEMEIIEFPVVVIDIKTNKVIDEFHSYVKPTKHPKLTKFCTELTGIQQAQVDSAPTFDEVLQQAEMFIMRYSDGVFVTCGDWDLQRCYPNQLKMSRVYPINPNRFKTWINIKHEFKKKYKVKAHGMTTMLDYLKIELKGKHHSGIDDSRNIARIAQRMITDGYHFV